MSPFILDVAALMLLFAISATAVWTTSSLMAFAIRRSSAAMKHRLWGLSMLAVLASPVVIPLSPLPRWFDLRLADEKRAESSVVSDDNLANANPYQAASDVVRLSAGNRIDEESVGQQLARETERADTSASIPREAEDVMGAGKPSGADGVTVAEPGALAERRGRDVVTTIGTSSPVVQSAAFSWRQILLALIGIWIAGILTQLAIWIAVHARCVRLVRRAIDVTVEADIHQCKDLCDQLGIQRHIALVVSADSKIPFVMHWNSPIVVLPAGYANWTAERLRVVLAHELSHIARHDLSWEVAARLCLMLVWYHPLAWAANWRLRVEREHACDDAVLSMGERASDYATHLIEIAKNVNNGKARLSPTVAMASGSHVESRVKSILDSAVPRIPAGRLWSVLSALILLVAITLAAVMTPSLSGADDKDPPAKERQEVSKPVAKDDLLAKLRQREQKFDNRSIEVEQTWDEPKSPKGMASWIRHNTIRFGGDDPGMPEGLPDDYQQPHRVRYLWTQRGDETTYEVLGDLAKAVHPKHGPLEPRWFISTAYGYGRGWNPDSNRLSIGGQRPDVWKHLLVCGHGFSTSIQDVWSATQVDGGYVMTGSLNRNSALVGDRKNDFELHLDEDLLLRKAIIRYHVKDYVLETFGRIESQGKPALPARATLQIFHINTKDNPHTGKKVGERMGTDGEYEYKIISLTEPLTDKQYKERVDIAIPARVHMDSLNPNADPVNVDFGNHPGLFPQDPKKPVSRPKMTTYSAEAKHDAASFRYGPELTKTQLQEVVRRETLRATAALDSIVDLRIDGQTSLQDIIASVVREHRINICLDESSFYKQGIEIHRPEAMNVRAVKLRIALKTLLDRVLAGRDSPSIVEVRDGVIRLAATLPWQEQESYVPLRSVVFHCTGPDGKAMPEAVVATKGGDGIYHTYTDIDGLSVVVGQSVYYHNSVARDRTGKHISYRGHSLFPKKPVEPYPHKLVACEPTVVTVSDASGTPVEGALVGISCCAAAAKVTDAVGVAELLLPPGMRFYSVFATKAGQGLDFVNYQTQWSDAPPSNLDLKLTKAREISLMVRDDEGMPLAGVPIAPRRVKRVTDVSNDKQEELGWNSASAGAPVVLTDENGVAKFDLVPTGMEVTFGTHLEEWKHNTLSIESDHVGDVDFKMTRAVTISGNVVDQDGKSIAGARITASPYYFAPIATDESGGFKVRVAPGRRCYIEALVPKSMKGDSGWLDPVANVPLSVEIRMKPMSRVFGQATYIGDQSPVAGASISLNYEGPPGRDPIVSGNRTISNGYGLNAYADEDGRYEFFVGPGKYQLMVMFRSRTEREFTVLGSEDHNIDLEELRTVPFRGRVVTGEPARGVEGIKVKLKPLAYHSWHWDVTTDAEGNFSSTRDHVPGVVLVSNEDESLMGFAAISEDEMDLEFRVSAPVSIKARLFDTQERPLVAEDVTCGIYARVEPDGETARTHEIQEHRLTTDGNGEVTFEKIIAGATYTIRTGSGGAKYFTFDRPSGDAVIDITIPLARAKRGSPKAMDDSNTKLTIDQTIEMLRDQGDIDAADHLAERLAFIKEKLEPKGDSFIFGRVVVNEPDNPKYCDAQMAIHSSGWFIGNVDQTGDPVGFHMYGYHPSQVVHGGERGSYVNVGDVVMRPFRFDELATLRAEFLFEGEVDPSSVSVDVVMRGPKTNTRTGGTNGRYSQPEIESTRVGESMRIQKTGLTPLPHYIRVTAPRHLPFTKDFDLQPGGTTDVGVLRIGQSPSFDIEYTTADTPDFTNSERRNRRVFVGERFRTSFDPNADSIEWAEAGEIRIVEKKRAYEIHCGLGGLILIDLGVASLDDVQKPVVPEELPRGRVPSLKDGHVYLIGHRYYKPWKHWTLLRVEMTSH